MAGVACAPGSLSGCARIHSANSPAWTSRQRSRPRQKGQTAARWSISARLTATPAIATVSRVATQRRAARLGVTAARASACSSRASNTNAISASGMPAGADQCEAIRRAQPLFAPQPGASGTVCMRASTRHSAMPTSAITVPRCSAQGRGLLGGLLGGAAGSMPHAPRLRAPRQPRGRLRSRTRRLRTAGDASLPLQWLPDRQRPGAGRAPPGRGSWRIEHAKASALARIVRGDESLLAALPVAAYDIRVDEDDRHRFLIPEGGVAAVGSDGEARYAMRPELPEDLLRHVLIGQLLPNALALAPSAVAAVLHASVVRFGAAAVAFLGEGGIGKSTLAAACHAAGLAVLCDDCAPLVEQEAEGTAEAPAGRLLVRPGPPRLKLWPDTVAAFRLEPLVAGPIHQGSPKRLLALPRASVPLAEPQAVPLACIYQLEVGEAVAVRPLAPSEAIPRLYQQCFGHRRRSEAGRKRHFTQVGTVAVRADIHVLSVPRGFATLPRLVELIASRHPG